MRRSEKAADNSKRRLGPRAGLDAVVLGGDKRAVAELRADPRLAPYLDLAGDRFLTVPDPKLAVLKDTPRLFLAVRIRLTEPAALSGTLKSCYHSGNDCPDGGVRPPYRHIVMSFFIADLAGVV
jgi:hypothetical protein